VHMNEWRRTHRLNNFTDLVLHRPRMKYDEAALVVQRHKKLHARLKCFAEKDVGAAAEIITENAIVEFQPA